MRKIIENFRQLFPLLPRGAKRTLIVYAIISIFVALLDFVSLGILALVFPALSGGNAMTVPLLGELHNDWLIPLLVIALMLIVVKSLIAVIMSWIITRIFAKYELQIGQHLFDAYLRSPWFVRQSRTTSELVRLADVGVSGAVTGFLLPLAGLPLQVFTLLSIFGILFVAEPVTALITVLFFGFVAVVLYFIVNRRIYKTSVIGRDYSLSITRHMTDMLSALKELTLRNKLQEVSDEVTVSRTFLTRSRANIYFLNQIPRYAVEIGLVLGMLLIGGVAYLTGGIAGAATSIAFFGIAGFRIIPALTAIQAAISSATNQLPMAELVIREIQSAGDVNTLRSAEKPREKVAFQRDIKIDNVSFRYPGSDHLALNRVSLDIQYGTSIAFVGHSGSGKSTLVDVLLGLQTPDSGMVYVDSTPMTDVIEDWRSSVSYVPQEVVLFTGSIAQNVALTWGANYDLDKVKSALDRAQLLDIILDKFDGDLEGPLGERGAGLSGGQKQRLGIARALYTDPKVLVMDEATSALDTATEAEVTRAISQLKGEITIVTVAHRLATIQDSDVVCFMKNGAVVDSGSFAEIVARQPEFAHQAKLAGLA